MAQDERERAVAAATAATMSLRTRNPVFMANGVKIFTTAAIYRGRAAMTRNVVILKSVKHSDGDKGTRHRLFHDT
jgi:hypothetical protein